ncbi:MAG: hypothetical protein H7249_16330 [Chitinophagaceae bacterium]|nr:hypothetical protein [Oligoflexus sp.]
MNSVFVVILGLVLVACQQPTLIGDSIKQGSTTSGTTFSETPTPSPSVGNAQENKADISTPVQSTPVSLDPVSASQPVVVSGASLICILNINKTTMCSAQDAKSKPFHFKPTRAFVATDAKMSWKPVSFANSINPSTWIIKVDPQVSQYSFAVTMMDDASEYLFNWVLSKNNSTLNLIKESSFEFPRVDPVFVETTSIISQSSHSPWLSSIINPVAPCVPLIQLQSSLISTAFLGSSGSQWVELTSPCALGLGMQRNRVVVSQSFQGITGHSYQITFDYRNSPGDSTVHAMKVTFGNDTIFSKATPEVLWTRYNQIVTPKVAPNIIIFLSQSNDENRATAIDNIIVSDLGILSPPSAP